VTLAFCQDVQAEAYDYPASFFAERSGASAARRPTLRELAEQRPPCAPPGRR
jgi:3D-(3,5/4)-trihydroxycyclohexane-1,2-dione acylhydrolase (decyclizing)